VKLVQQTLAEIFVEEPVRRLVGDNAYDSDQLDRDLAEAGVEMIAPHRSNRTRMTQDGRSLRRYRRRWKIERLLAWLQNFRRLVTHYEHSLDNFTGMIHLACALILLRHLMRCVLDLRVFKSSVASPRASCAQSDPQQ
jgi:transposase